MIEPNGDLKGVYSDLVSQRANQRYQRASDRRSTTVAGGLPIDR